MRAEHRAIYNYPLRQAVRYTATELRQILAAFDMGFSVAEIADDHQRSEGGIATALDRMIQRRANGLNPFQAPQKKAVQRGFWKLSKRTAWKKCS